MLTISIELKGSMGVVAETHDRESLKNVIEALNTKSKDNINFSLSERLRFARAARYFANITECSETIVLTNIYYSKLLVLQGEFYEASGVLAGIYDECFHEIHDSLKVEFLTNIGLANFLAGYYNNSLEYYLKALALAEKSFLFEIQIEILNKLGQIYESHGEFKEAGDFYANALKLAINYNYDEHIINSFINLGKASSYDLSADSLLSLIQTSYWKDEGLYTQPINDEAKSTLWPNTGFYVLLIILLVIILVLALFIVRLIYKKIYILKLKETLKEKNKSKKQLIFSESKYFSLIRALNEGLIYLDADDKILYLNEKACSVFTGTIDNLTELKIYDLIYDQEDVEMFQAKHEQRKKGIDYRYEIKMKNVSDELIWVKLSMSPLFDDQKQYIGSIVLVDDITERKKYDEGMKDLTSNLNQKIKQLNCLYDISDITSIPNITFDEIFVKSLNIIPFGFKYSHDTCVEIVFENREFRSDNFIETEWSYIVPIKLQKKKLGHIRVCYVEEKPFVNKDPFHFDEKIIIKNIAEKLGQVIEVKNMEKELRKSRQKLELTQKVANIGDMEWDLKKDHKIFSESFFDLLELPVESRFFFDEEMFFKIMHDDDREHITDIFQRISEKDFSNLNFNLRVVKFDGTIKNLIFAGDIVAENKNKPSKLVFTIQDLEKQKMQQQY